MPHLVDIKKEFKKTIDAVVFINSAKPGVALALALESAAREVTVYVATNSDIAPDALETPAACFVESSAVFESSIAANDPPSTPHQINSLVSDFAITTYSFCWPKFRARFMKYVDVFIAHYSFTARNAQALAFDEEERKDLLSVGDAF